MSHAIVLALSALGFDAWGTAPTPQMWDPAAATIAGSGCGHFGGRPSGGGWGCGAWGACGEGLCAAASQCLHCMNGMPQHLPYFNPAWGYDFFRPYGYSVLLEQQAEIAAMGGNPIQPYDNRFFERIFEEVEALPAASPVPEPYPIPPPSIPPVIPVAPSDPLPRLPAAR